MTKKRHTQTDDLQRTVLIPVLSLQPGVPPGHGRMPNEGGSDAPPAYAVAKADAICEQVMRDKITASVSSNPMIATAARLTTLAGLLRTADAPENFVHFSQLLIDAVREFDRELVHTQVRHDTAMVARYILCCVIDEAVLSTTWGLASGWAHRSLLRLFHNEANGGERFFSLLEHAIRHQNECRDLLELFYLCLALGFEGRLHIDPRGQDKIETLRAQLFRMLYSDLPRQSILSSSWRPATAFEPCSKKRPALQLISIAVALIAFLGVAGMRLWLHVSADNVAAAYEHSFHSPSSSERR